MENIETNEKSTVTENEKPFLRILSENRASVIRLEIGLLLLVISFLFMLDAFAVTILRVAAFLLCGCGVIISAGKDLRRGKVFSESVLMSVAGICAVCIGETADAVAVMLLFEVGELLEELAVERSRSSVSDLIDLTAKTVTMVKDGEMVPALADDIRAGDVVSVAPGEMVPVDGEVVRGESTLNTAAVTGESLPRDCSCGDKVYSGSINITGNIFVRACVDYADSTVSKVAQIIKRAEAKKSERERFITRFSSIYTPIVFALTLIVGVFVPLLGAGDYPKWLYRALVMLVVSCPCALVISVPLTYFAGIGGAAKRGILFKSSEAIDIASKLTSVIYDKTGTLSTGKFEVIDVVPAEGLSRDDLLKLAVMAETPSNHPIARSVCAYADFEADGSWISEHTEIRGKGSVVTLSNSKLVYAGNAELMEDLGVSYEPAPYDVTSVYVCAGGRYAGRIDLFDTPKNDAERAVKKLRDMGVVNIALMTGDNALSATRIGRQVGITEIYADCLPQDKVERVEYLLKLQREGEALAFVGDGINDVPVLASADLGVAMGAFGSDAAIEAADVVIMNDQPSKVADAIKSSRRTTSIVTQNVTAALAVKIIVMILGLCGVAPMWMGVFADSGIMLITVLNAMRALK